MGDASHVEGPIYTGTADSQVQLCDNSGNLFHAGTQISAGAAVLNAAIAGVASGYKIARGTLAATATASVATGLSTVVNFVAMPLEADATGANYCSLVTGVKSSGTAGTIVLYRWKPTSAGTTTLIAATTAASLHWMAIGT